MAEVDKEFSARRQNVLRELYDMEGDRSRKGSVDAPIQELVDTINSHPHMFTTSSCSGRISCFAEPTEASRAAGKKGGEWVYASHDKAEEEELLSKAVAAASGGGCLVFRMEPFVMHVECQGVEWSAQLLAVARQGGYRESGLVPSGKGRCMVGIRCSIRLEVPVADNGAMLVGDDYMRYLVRCANEKFDLNAERHGRLLGLIKAMPATLPAPKKKQQQRSGRRGQGRQARSSKGAGGADGGAKEPGALADRTEALLARQLLLLERLGAAEEAVEARAGGAARGGRRGGRGSNRRGGAGGKGKEAGAKAPLQQAEAAAGAVLRVHKAHAKKVKDVVKSNGWLDASRKGGETEGGMVALPVTAALAERAAGAGAGAGSGAAGASKGQGKQLPEPLAGLLGSGAATLDHSVFLLAKKVSISPFEKLREAVRALAAGALPESRLRQLPSKWERLGDLALLPSGSFVGPDWEALPQAELWGAVAGALGVKRLARQAPVANTGTRDSQAELLLGGDGWVEHKESGVAFRLDVTLCMFSSGNVTERTRMGRLLEAAGETVVDLFCGIGYYTLPLLVRAGVSKVYACEWNPNALEALRRNLERNGVAEWCDVLPGDCRETAPKGVADRVMLGLLPSSTCGWGTAVAALKDAGGWLHIHENVKDSNEASWVEETLDEIRVIAAASGRSWDVSRHHLERVKWYAPHVRHVVLDVRCQKTPRSGV